MPTIGQGINRACYRSPQTGYSFTQNSKSVSCPNFYQNGMIPSSKWNTPDDCISNGNCWIGFLNNGTSACYQPIAPIPYYTNYSGQFQIISQALSSSTAAFGLSAINNSLFGMVNGDTRQIYQWGPNNTIQSGFNNNYCLDSSITGGAVAQALCNSSSLSQQWIVFNDGTVSSIGSPGQCLYIGTPSAAVLNGSAMISASYQPCNSSSSGQLWLLSLIGGNRYPNITASQQAGLFYIRNVLTGKVIDQYAYTTTSGFALNEHTATATANEFFKWTSTGSLQMLNGGMCLSKKHTNASFL